MATKTQKSLIAAEALSDVNAAIAGVNAALSTSVASVTNVSDPDILYDRQRQALADAVGVLATAVAAVIAEVDALQVMTTAGDIIVAGASGVPARLAKGANGDVLTMVAGTVAWAAPV